MGIGKIGSRLVQANSRLMLRLGRPDAALAVFDWFHTWRSLIRSTRPARDRQYLRVARALQQGAWTVDFGERLASDLAAYEKHFAGLETYRGWFATGSTLARCFFGSVSPRPPNRTWAAPTDRPVRVLVVARNIDTQAFLAEPMRALIEQGAELRGIDAQPLVDTAGKALAGHPDVRPVFLYARGAAPSTPDEIGAYIRAADPALAEAIDWADVVYVEWADKAALWLSQGLPWSKKLVVRCHSYEALTTFPLFLRHGRIDTLIFIAPHVRAIYATHPVDDPGVFARSVVVQNVRPPEQPAPPLPDDKRRFRLGLLGFDRQIKDPLFAIGILRSLLDHDRRWTLVMGGRDFPPIAEGDTSPAADYVRAYRAACHALRDHIEFSGYVTDKAPWFAGIGFILSASLREGSHEAVVEGMAHGCIPVLRDWPMATRFGGAAGSFPGLDVHTTPTAAAAQILRDAEAFGERSAMACKIAGQHFFSGDIRRAFASAVMSNVQTDQQGPAT